MDGALCEVKVRWGDSVVLLNHGGTKWNLPQVYADDAVLVVKLEDEVDEMVGHFGDACNRNACRSFYNGRSACVRVDSAMSEWFAISVEEYQGCAVP